MISNCVECGWPIRKRNETIPGTRIGYTNGTCGACYQRGLRASKHMPTPRPRIAVNTDTSWQDNAACATTDPDMFTLDQGASSRDAKEVCASCEVKAKCLQYALDNREPDSIWGGKTAYERRVLLRNAKRKEQAA